MKTIIWKFPIKVTNFQILRLPKGATILCVQVQNGEPCLWAQVDPSKPLREIGILTYGTGHGIIETDMFYIGTYQLPQLVFHVFRKEI